MSAVSCSRQLATYDHPLDVLTFLQQEKALGASVALVAVTHTQGGSVRSSGAVVGVSSREKIAGHISNGCVDGALMFQAMAAMQEQRVSELRFGAGSPYKDLQLPCGGAIDLLIIPHPDMGVFQTVCEKLKGRQEVNLLLGLDGRVALSDDPIFKSGWQVDRQRFGLHIRPKLIIRIAGVGAEMMALTRLAVASGYDVIVQSPNQEMIGQAVNMGAKQGVRLKGPTSSIAVQDDPWTAFVLLFHDHDWEQALLIQALQGPAFYIGALGSLKTHALRCEQLRALGHVSEADIHRIHGPIGLVPSLRDASMVAVSCLAEIIQKFVEATH